MSIAGIEKIREAELSAERLKRSAEEEAAGIVAEAKKEAKGLLEQAEAEGSAAYKAVIAEAEESAERLYGEKISAEQSACENLKAAARENLDRAVAQIVGKVVGTDGNR